MNYIATLAAMDACRRQAGLVNERWASRSHRREDAFSFAFGLKFKEADFHVAFDHESEVAPLAHSLFAEAEASTAPLVTDSGPQSAPGDQRG